MRFDSIRRGWVSLDSYDRKTIQREILCACARQGIAMLGLTRKTRAKSEPPVQPNLQPCFEVLCFRAPPGYCQKHPHCWNLIFWERIEFLCITKHKKTATPSNNDSHNNTNAGVLSDLIFKSQLLPYLVCNLGCRDLTDRPTRSNTVDK
jgi:hypothetical protein